jgi:hypothetical protein
MTAVQMTLLTFAKTVVKRHWSCGPRDLFHARSDLSDGTEETEEDEEGVYPATISLSMHQYTASLPPLATRTHHSSHHHVAAARPNSTSSTWSARSTAVSDSGNVSWSALSRQHSQSRTMDYDCDEEGYGYEHSDAAYISGSKMAASRLHQQQHQQRRGGLHELLTLRLAHWTCM